MHLQAMHLRRSLLPPPPYLWLTARNAALAWVCLRLALAFARVYAPGWRAAALVVAVPVALVLVDVRMLRERTLLEDCATPLASLAVVAATVALLLECGAQAVLRAAGVAA